MAAASRAKTASEKRRESPTRRGQKMQADERYMDSQRAPVPRLFKQHPRSAMGVRLPCPSAKPARQRTAHTQSRPRMACAGGPKPNAPPSLASSNSTPVGHGSAPPLPERKTGAPAHGAYAEPPARDLRRRSEAQRAPVPRLFKQHPGRPWECASLARAQNRRASARRIRRAARAWLAQAARSPTCPVPRLFTLPIRLRMRLPLSGRGRSFAALFPPDWRRASRKTADAAPAMHASGRRQNGYILFAERSSSASASSHQRPSFAAQMACRRANMGSRSPRAAKSSMAVSGRSRPQ